MKFLILISLVYLVVAEEDLMEVPGKCPEVPVMSNIDHSKLMNKWYVFRLFESSFDENEKCGEDEFKTMDGDVWTGVYRYVNKTTNKWISGDFNSTPAVDATQGERTSYSIWDNEPYVVTSRYVDIDYDSYVIAWQCKEKGENSLRAAFVATRSRDVPEDDVKKIKAFFDKHNMGYSSLVTMDQTNCPTPA